MSHQNLLTQLVEIATQYIIKEGAGTVIAEPYIPFLPKRWNRFLVLAEAQNLNNTNYVSKLKSMDTTTRIRRLYLEDKDIGIRPWDDESLKIALIAAFPKVNVGQIAVSNAVLWSIVDEKGRNLNPSPQLIERSCSLWAKMLPILDPQYVITAGKIAKEVIETALRQSHLKPVLIPVRLPSPQIMSRISGMFNENDLLRRFPEVRAAVEAHPDWVRLSRQNKIFFACHVVSLVSQHMIDGYH